MSYKGHGVSIQRLRQYCSGTEARFFPHYSNLFHDIIATSPIESSFNDYTVRYNDAQHFADINYPLKGLPRCLQKVVLPAVATDIKGVDSTVYKQVQRGKMTRKMPTVESNEYFTLHFFPRSHFLALARKSNISYTFTNKGGYMLNNPILEKKFKQYSGPYRAHDFFRKSLYPLDVATSRSKYRKFVKTSLFDSMRKHVKHESEVNLLAGIFFFKLTLFPIRDDDKFKVRSYLDGSIISLLRNKSLRNKIEICTRDQNRLFNNGKQFLKTVKKNNYLRNDNVPNCFPKLPFIEDYDVLK